ncbi:hypothetical protein [Mesomycoplasma hyopneumoniae]|uniref:hypothetical protein n=1 Tax=Mesomycoplasma hyopneumoniae TaxID=2099 RepID=UPI0032AF514D
MKISLPNIKLIQNNNENLIKVIQVSFVLNFYGLINRTPRDLGLLIFSLITFKSSIRKNIIFKSKISPSWNLEIIEINKYFTFLKILRILDLKYKINQQLKDKEILIYSNENKKFILRTLYKLVVLLTFI